MQRNIKLIIFDMDGVLVDACEWHRISLNHALKKICNYEIPIEDHYKKFNGIPTKIKLQILAERGIIDVNQFKDIEYFKQLYTIEQIKKFASYRQEKVDLLNYIKKKNYKVACYTNSIRNTAELMLEKTGILKYFDLLITNEDVIKPKPDPYGYNLCLKYFNISELETLILEDSEIGIAAAKASGCNVIEIKNIDDVNIKLIEDII